MMKSDDAYLIDDVLVLLGIIDEHEGFEMWQRFCWYWAKHED